MFSKEYFKDYNYEKHAAVCLGVYGVLFAFDMTVSYFILKKMFAKMEAEGLLDEE
ncbi:MAG: hypothetical protein MJ161_05290 [Clostridia bacterium]|nr:hypothetical protein [Clostridia bacterium]